MNTIYSTLFHVKFREREKRRERESDREYANRLFACACVHAYCMRSVHKSQAEHQQRNVMTTPWTLFSLYSTNCIRASRMQCQVRSQSKIMNGTMHNAQCTSIWNCIRLQWIKTHNIRYDKMWYIYVFVYSIFILHRFDVLSIENNLINRKTEDSKHARWMPLPWHIFHFMHTYMILLFNSVRLG